jgi:hypothetical protein
LGVVLRLVLAGQLIRAGLQLVFQLGGLRKLGLKTGSLGGGCLRFRAQLFDLRLEAWRPVVTSAQPERSRHH